MKFAIIFALFCITCTLANPLGKPTSTPSPLLKHDEMHDENSYTVEYELADGTLVHERGEKVVVKDEEGEDQVFFKRVGYYKYQAPEGDLIEVHYTADENGFVAHGPHLPKPVQA